MFVRMALAVISVCVTMDTLLEQINTIVKVSRNRQDILISLLADVWISM